MRGNSLPKCFAVPSSPLASSNSRSWNLDFGLRGSNGSGLSRPNAAPAIPRGYVRCGVSIETSSTFRSVFAGYGGCHGRSACLLVGRRPPISAHFSAADIRNDSEVRGSGNSSPGASPPRSHPLCPFAIFGRRKLPRLMRKRHGHHRRHPFRLPPAFPPNFFGELPADIRSVIALTREYRTRLFSLIPVSPSVLIPAASARSRFDVTNAF